MTPLIILICLAIYFIGIFITTLICNLLDRPYDDDSKQILSIIWPITALPAIIILSIKKTADYIKKRKVKKIKKKNNSKNIQTYTK